MPQQRFVRDIGGGEVRHPTWVSLLPFPECPRTDCKYEFITLFPVYSLEALDCKEQMNEGIETKDASWGLRTIWCG